MSESEILILRFVIAPNIGQDPCVLRTTVFSYPSLHRQGEPKLYEEEIPPSAYLYRNAGHHFVNNNFYCPVSSGEVFKVRGVVYIARCLLSVAAYVTVKLSLNGTLMARYTVGGTLSSSLFSSSVTHNDSLYVTQSSCCWTAYLDVRR